MPGVSQSTYENIETEDYLNTRSEVVTEADMKEINKFFESHHRSKGENKL
jgi:hypothetical protein